MATHGCLLITPLGERHPRVWLHTSHTGMHIPDAVWTAMAVVAKNKLYFGEFANTRDKLIAKLDWGNVSSMLGDANFAAAAVIAAEPCLLEPINATQLRHLPEWGGQHSPYRLKVSDRRWVLMGEDRTKTEPLLDFDPLAEVAKLIIDNYKPDPAVKRKRKI